MKQYFWKTLEAKITLCPYADARINVGHGDLPLHVQEDFSLLAFIHTGTGTKIVGQQRYELCPHSVFVIHSKVPHAYIDTQNLYLTNFCYTEELWKVLPAMLQSLPGFQVLFHIEPILRRTRHYPAQLVLDTKTFDSMIQLIDGLISMESRHPALELMTTARITDLFSQLSYAYEKQNSASSTDSYPMKLARTVLWIERNLEQPLGNTEISEYARISSRSLTRLFKEVYRQTPKEFVMFMRLRKACELLRSTDEHNITEIAFQCGFSDSNYFSRQFRKAYGCQPREYRKNLPGA